MLILLSLLMIGVPGKSANLENLQGKWTVGLGMPKDWPLFGLFSFTQYSVSWRSWKTVAIGIDGSGFFSGRDNCSNSEKNWSWSVGIGFYKYFLANSSFSPFIALSPHYSMSYSYDEGIHWHEYSDQAYSVNINPGVEYFFGLLGKQLSLRFKTSLVSASRTYSENKNSDREGYSYVRDRVSFYFPTQGSLSTWLCFHF